MKTSLDKTLTNIEWNYENICRLLIGFQQATSTKNNNVEVMLIDKEGNENTYNINSFQNVLSELQRIDNNFKSLINSDNISYIVNADGSMNQITKTSFINAYYFDNITVNQNDLIIDRNSIIKNFVFPNVKLPITIKIDNNPFNQINALMFDIEEGYNKIKENITLLELKYLISQGTVTLKSEDEITLSAQKEYIKYHGKFNIINVKPIPNFDNEYYLTLDKLVYSSINTLEQSIQLKTSNLLADKNGTSLYEINEIENNTKTIRVKRIKGIGTLNVGINQLNFNQEVKSTIDDEIVVGVPIKPNSKYVIFIRTENQLNIGVPTEGIKINTETYKITYNEETMSLDVFFSKYVTNFSDYLVSLIKDTTIPYSLGIKPTRPNLTERNFNIVQINKHLTTSKSAVELEKVNDKKESIKNNIDFKKSEISKVQNEIDTVKYKTIEEKKYRQEKITELQNDINSLSQNFLNVTRDLNDNAVKAGLKNVKPKYKLIGFWEIQKPIISPSTKPQNIIGYEIQYRYLSKNIDTIESTTMKMYDSKSNEITVAVSPWNSMYSKTLNKAINLDGTTSWQEPKMESVDDININQCSISISEGESIEVKVRAISEAGYPISPINSEWSNILRYDFPQNLTDESLFTLVENNNDDLKIAELNNILRQSGIIKHMLGEVIEAEKTYSHKAEDITSGFYSPEMSNIPLHIALRNMRTDIDILMKKELQETVKVSVIDFKNEEYNVINNSTLEINGGNYNEQFNLVDKSKYGSIIRKQGFIKIRNNSQLPIELKSLVPGNYANIDQTNAPTYYNVPIKFGTEDLKQAPKQIIYFRNIDISGLTDVAAFQLIKQRLAPTTNTPLSTDINETVTIEENKNLIYIDNDSVKTCALNNNSQNNFNIFTKEHPLYVKNEIELLKQEFERLKVYTQNLKDQFYQDEYSNNIEFLGFNNNDIYSVGKNTCGAWLYPVITNPATIMVSGNNSISSLIIQKETELLIPFVYEYRMIDRIGNVDGDTEKTINDDLEYTKKIGIDMLINNNTFKFDIQVTSKLRAKITPLDTLNLTSVMGSFNPDSLKPNSLS